MDILYIVLLSIICVSALTSIILHLANRKRNSGFDINKIGHDIALIQDENQRISAALEYIGKNVSTELSANRRETAENNDRVYKRLEEISINSERRASAMSERLSETMHSSLNAMMISNEKKLDEMRLTVDEKLTSTLTTRLDSSFKTVSDRLENLYKSLGEMKELSTGMTENISSLNKVLTNVKARGTWAEYQLENILDETIPGMYEKNYSPSGTNGFVEFAIKIPSGDDSATVTYLPVDSKFPMEDYIRLTEAAERGDTQAVNAARNALLKRVTDEAKEVSKYISVPQTTPFAILYLATEGLYAEVASSASMPVEKFRRDYGVMIAGPTTITALLSSFAVGFRAVNINKKADEIRLLLGSVKSQYEKFDEILRKIKKKIGEADTAVDSAAKRNDIIIRKLKGVESNTALDSDIEIRVLENEDQND